MTLGQNQEGASAHCGLGTRPNSDDDSGQPEGNASESRPGKRIASHVACRGCRHFIGAFHHLCGCIERNERMHRVDLLNVGGNSAIWVWLITEQGAGLALAWACSEGQPPPAKKAKKSQKKPRKDQPLFAVQWRPGSFACPPPPGLPETLLCVLGGRLSPTAGTAAWGWRVVLDEAHTIKSAKTRMAKAAYALQSECFWAVTGTPPLPQP